MVAGKVLITGFEPFGGSGTNPSGNAARDLHGQKVAGRTVVGRVLPVVYQEAIARAIEYIEEVGPELVVMTGQSDRGEFSIEKVAVNISGPGMDNAGNQPLDEPVVPGGPAAYFSTLPVRAIVQALKAAGVPAQPSYTAGTYLCNHVFYGVMHHLKPSSIPAGFIHIPPLPEQAASRGGPSMTQELINRGLLAAVDTSLATPGLVLEHWRERAEQFLRCIHQGRLEGRNRWWELAPDYEDLFSTTALAAEGSRAQGELRERIRGMERLTLAGKLALALRPYRDLLESRRYLELLPHLPTDYFSLQAELAGTDLEQLAYLAGVCLESTAQRYHQLVEGGPLPTAPDGLFPADRLLRALERTIQDLGLEGAPLRLEPGASVPQAALTTEAWLHLAPADGFEAYRQNLNAAGRALHLAHMRSGLPLEYRRMGDPALIPASGLLFEHLASDQLWLEQVAGISCGPSAARKLQISRLFHLRKHAALIQGFWHAGQMVTAKAYYGEQKLHSLVEYVSESTGSAYPLKSAAEALTCWARVLTGFRAMLIENSIRHRLTDQLGPAWPQQKAAGDWLREFWASGTRPRHELESLGDCLKDF